MDGGNRKVSILKSDTTFLNNAFNYNFREAHELKKSRNIKKRRRNKRVPHRKPYLLRFSRELFKCRPMRTVRSIKSELCAHISRLVSVKRVKSANSAMTWL